MAVIPVALAGRGYDVHIGRGLLERTGALAGPLLRKRRVAVIADRNAWNLHGQRLEQGLREAGKDADVYLVEPGEGSKSWQSLAALTDWLLAREVERGDNVLALGGGVVGDLTGFAAAILKRGCGFIQLPTSLLAQVDSSVGGKTAINTAAGKNLIGAFHQPSMVLADLDALGTLPDRELRAGYAEVLKYGVLGDRAFFDWLTNHGPAVLALEDAPLEHAVATSVAMKAAIVAEDERETTGQRALLNLGHTFGHALEAETGFSDRLLHGEAVALGMVLAARYSARTGLMEATEAEAVAGSVRSAGLPSEIAQLRLDRDGGTLVDHMRHDKKMDAGTLPFVLLRGIGQAFLARDVALSDVALFLDEELRR
ncbi:3-dehydroquinate synthase [Altererythrobacter sp. TH136]|uniref:3-dehydroquinate synthase n=1 Tax=Altererythrobacter sp. TH136 TaxID=2067415 RepID=UPI001161DAC0|nr:3-dehydroquinate synthase [Altererythrobacter sp. TH136]QDM40182.1 3-dehydroquinate synthase [Altererythrobacter sp. TH136]